MIHYTKRDFIFVFLLCRAKLIKNAYSTQNNPYNQNLNLRLIILIHLIYQLR